MESLERTFAQCHQKNSDAGILSELVQDLRRRQLKKRNGIQFQGNSQDIENIGELREDKDLQRRFRSTRRCRCRTSRLNVRVDQFENERNNRVNFRSVTSLNSQMFLCFHQSTKTWGRQFIRLHG